MEGLAQGAFRKSQCDPHPLHALDACRLLQDIEQHLCADKGYDGQPALELIVSKHYIPNVKRRGEEIQEKKENPGWRARRWVVEVSHSWFNRFRKILVRYEKLKDTYLALLHMAAAIIAYRKAGFIYG
jgi:putative transposase